MQVKCSREGMDDAEVAMVLSEYIHNEHLSEPVIAYLEKKAKHEPGEEIPEHYMRTIVRQLKDGGDKLSVLVVRNQEKWLVASGQKKALWRQNDPLLTPEQLDELRLLIRATYCKAVGVATGVSSGVEKKWAAIGIRLSDAPELDRWITQSYVAGRLANILTNANTYDEMITLARRLPLTRQDELCLRAVQDSAARYITGYGQKMSGIADDIALLQHQKATSWLVQQYYAGNLKQTKYNEDGLTHDEVEALLSTDSPVNNTRELASEFRNRFKTEDSTRDWDRVAETEARFATNTGRLATIQMESGAPPGDTMIYFIVQPTACKHCKEVYLEPDGITPRLFPLSEILDNVERTGGMNMGLKASLIGEHGGWVPNMVLHPHCLTGDMMVDASNILATTKRWYDGDIVIINTAAGNRLSCTPNHPILTPSGWVAAGDLDIGCEVVGSNVRKRIGLVDNNNQHMPSSIKEVVDSFGKSSDVTARPVPLSSEDFHGDGKGSKVAVVYANGLLLNKVSDSSHSECIGNLFFKIGDLELPLLDGDGVPHLRFNRHVTTPNSFMGCIGYLLSFFMCGFRHAVKLSVAAISKRHAQLLEPISDSKSADVGFSLQGKDGLPGQILADEFINRHRDSGGMANIDASAHETLFNGVGVDAKGTGDVVLGAPVEIFTDYVVNIQRHGFSGHVYNLQTKSGTYVAENIITHNCHCVPTRYIEGYSMIIPKGVAKHD